MKKRPNIFYLFISCFFASKEPFKKDDVERKMFMENLELLILKNHLLLQFVESVVKMFDVAKLCFCVQFTFEKKFTHYFA
jgi:hypothetical protein